MFGNVKILGWLQATSVGPPPISDKNFVFQQLIPSDTWVVNHMLNKFVAVEITDNAQKKIQGEVYWSSVNTVILKFNSPIAGYCYCN